MKTLREMLMFGVMIALLPTVAHAQEIKVTLLGTGTPVPAMNRFGPSILVEAGGQRLLFLSTGPVWHVPAKPRRSESRPYQLSAFHPSRMQRREDATAETGDEPAGRLLSPSLSSRRFSR